MSEGVIRKALSGFYYVDDGQSVVTCRARGKHRHAKLTPLVGDRVAFTLQPDGSGALDEILPRKNEFYRPAVANIDLLVVVASEAIPATDPFLIDRVAAIAAARGCETLICVNKRDLEPGEELARVYERAGFPTVRVSARTGEGMEELRRLLAGRVCAFTGNSGVGKSSLLNALEADFDLATGEVSEKLGRGRHTTRHVELFRLSCGALAADTPGFSSFDVDKMELARKEELQYAFREFSPYLGKCRFQDCAHVKEKGCAVLAAVEAGEIPPTRHRSYVRLYEQARAIPDWQRKEQ
ncbi:ribosome small subunit-dependent GTPase A [Colidextribacter sp. OB.20]|uniref:ribosome small subunit-dependent GTPase A n=1 Tax=Colidextribacter sp. OB.20 TaxID=2304568 RepID=UPI001370F958|nr:ribosome small subunit-dependent GTPase A [Colidextribacter sp. OB.20]NBI09118.1 ribosome small subunit-dependent GTPase A [Colidextribacter sp. OB.20]